MMKLLVLSECPKFGGEWALTYVDVSLLPAPAWYSGPPAVTVRVNYIIAERCL